MGQENMRVVRRVSMAAVSVLLGGLMLGLAATMVSVSPVAACSCSGEPLTAYPDEVILAFTGRQVERTVVDERNADTGLKALFEVETVYKGEAGPTVAVWTSPQSSACGVDPGPGVVHVAAYQWQDKPVMGLCGSLVEEADLIDTFGPGQAPDPDVAAPEEAASSGSSGTSEGFGGRWLLAVIGAAGLGLVATGLWLRGRPSPTAD
jgi:hypothetical protein